MNNDMIAAERIAELEAQLEDAYVKIDLQQETIDEQDQLLRTMRAQIKALQNGQKVNYGVA